MAEVIDALEHEGRLGVERDGAPGPQRPPEDEVLWQEYLIQQRYMLKRIFPTPMFACFGTASLLVTAKIKPKSGGFLASFQPPLSATRILHEPFRRSSRGKFCDALCSDGMPRSSSERNDACGCVAHLGAHEIHISPGWPTCCLAPYCAAAAAATAEASPYAIESVDNVRVPWPPNKWGREGMRKRWTGCSR